MRRFRTTANVCAAAMVLLALSPGPGAAQPVTFLPQWSDQARTTFYSTSQGSHMMPLAWFKALKRLDKNEPFGADQLARYGYLANTSPGNTHGLPIGFVVDKRAPTQLGMTCAACHTNQLEYVKADQTRGIIRLDGAPALADFQQFLTDLTAAAQATLNDDTRFKDFARAVLGQNPSNAKVAQLKNEFRAWVTQFSDFMDRSLPDPAWGPGRLDAFGMIFNRVTGKDLGIAGNFRKADAPVSYPFLWNASRQDKTQWNGGVPNGLFIHGLGRNTGEVFGVFADFKPKQKTPPLFLIPKTIGFKENSADFAGLQTLEEQIVQLKPPKWPAEFGLKPELVARGETLFATHCAECHAKRDSKGPLGSRAWDTPVKAVGTDPKMVRNAAREVDPGVFKDSLLPPPVPLTEIGSVFEYPTTAVKVLASSVVGSLAEEALPVTPQKLQTSGLWRAFRKDLGGAGDHIEAILQNPVTMVVRIRGLLANLFEPPASGDGGAAYESRVLDGIWATAPYLHNGSVPDMVELLKPPAERPTKFYVGNWEFDPERLGFDWQSPSPNTFEFDTSKTGNSNSGHDYGTGLDDQDRLALIEYLKTL
jgi:hypothetical protein